MWLFEDIMWNQVKHTSEMSARDFPGSPMIKNLPPNAGDMDLIPGWESKIP